MIEASIIKYIIDSWAADQAHPRRDRAQRPLPSFEDVREVIETTFFASLEREEDRPIRFSVVLASPSELDNASHQYHRELSRFVTPVPFTVDSITKLAPAFDPAFSSIAVDRDSMTQELQCWGIFHYFPTVPSSFSISSVPKEGMWFRPDLFTVTARNPGSLQISRMNAHIGRFVSGSFIPAAPSPFASRSLGKYLMRSLASTDLWRRHDTLYWHHYRDALQVLLAESAARGHGATVVLLPSGGAAVPQDFIFAKYRLEADEPLMTYFEGVLRAVSSLDLGGTGYQRLILEHLQRLAQLSTVDGALILTSALELVAFGARLQASPWNGKPLLGPDGWGNTSGDTFPAQRYGTRHSSAINFAAACKGSIVFVISQDGPIRAFVWSDEGTVLCWPDCTESMFV
jgi:DisA bacterial checkpoint controller nucleotide-binding